MNCGSCLNALSSESWPQESGQGQKWNQRLLVFNLVSQASCCVREVGCDWQEVNLWAEKIRVVLLKAQLFAAAGVLMSSTPCYFLILRRYDGTTLVPPSHITKHVSKCHAPPVLADGKACCLIWGVFCLSEICPGRMETIVALAKTRLGYPGKGQN